MATFTKSEVEDAALVWLESLRWEVAHGPNITPHAASPKGSDYRQVVLEHRLRATVNRLNAVLPAAALNNTCRKLTRLEGSTRETRNCTFYRVLVDGVTVEYQTARSAVLGTKVSVLDYENPTNDDRLPVNQVTVIKGEHKRRPDTVLFVNGLPLGLIEFKNPTDEKATVWTACNQIPRSSTGTLRRTL